MGIDIRLPIGVLFTLLGVLLCAIGALGNPALYERSLGININLDWGVVLLVFGVVMLLLGRRGMKAIARERG
jgi:multisubunit Na+/H+ antiporter MnhG subunit